MTTVPEDLLRHRVLQMARLLAALLEARAEVAPAAERKALERQHRRWQKEREARAKTEAYVQRIVDQAPPLTEEQECKLALILAPTDAMRAEWRTRQARIDAERKQNRVTVRTAVGLR
jgi:hypothetical protein